MGDTDNIIECDTSDTMVLSCDDGDPCTVNDEEIVLVSDGTVCIPCTGIDNDCTTAEIEFDVCDDGDPCTINDVEGTNSCNGEICLPCKGDLFDESNIDYPNIFSPNDDGHNDHFVIHSSDGAYDIISLAIYDRLGNRVFAKSNFTTNSTLEGWDGRKNDERLGDGVYVFFAVLGIEDCSTVNIVGDITLIR